MLLVSPPTGVGIEIIYFSFKIFFAKVSPPTGVGIEIKLNLNQFLLMFAVSPPTGVGIEI